MLLLPLEYELEVFLFVIMMLITHLVRESLSDPSHVPLSFEKYDLDDIERQSHNYQEHFVLCCKTFVFCKIPSCSSVVWSLVFKDAI